MIEVWIRGADGYVRSWRGNNEAVASLRVGDALTWLDPSSSVPGQPLLVVSGKVVERSLHLRDDDLLLVIEVSTPDDIENPPPAMAASEALTAPRAAAEAAGWCFGNPRTVEGTTWTRCESCRAARPHGTDLPKPHLRDR